MAGSSTGSSFHQEAVECPRLPWLELTRPSKGSGDEVQGRTSSPQQCCWLAPHSTVPQSLLPPPAPQCLFPVSLSLTSPLHWNRGPLAKRCPPNCELLIGEGYADGVPVTQWLQGSKCWGSTPPPRPPAAPGFPTCRRLQGPDVLGPEGAVSLFQALPVGELGAELLVVLAVGPGDKVRPGDCKFRRSPGELVRVVGISGNIRRKNHP